MISLAIAAMTVPAMVFAGGINGAESRIIGAASGTFTYNGRSYVATGSALAQLTSYLGGVDLTDAQAEKAIGLMYDNIRGGVESGYLVPVGGGTPANQNGTGGAGANGSSSASAGVKVSSGTGVITAVDTKGATVLTADPAVKGTGYDGAIAIAIAAIAAGALLFVISLIIRKRLWIHEE